MVTRETLNYLFDDRPHVLKPSLTHWMNDLPRFADFVATHRDKIRKKIKGIHEADGFQDLAAELETAYRLLQEKRFDLAYEPYSQGTGRGPDFAVTFKTRVTFNVEVTRMRLTTGEGNEGPPPFNPPYESRRMAEIVSSKLRQMLPSMMNLLVVVADDQAMCELDVSRVMNRLKQRAEQKEPQLFQRHRFRDPADFFKYYYRLSGVWLISPGRPDTGQCPILWLNNQTKHPLPAPICTILQR